VLGFILSSSFIWSFSVPRPFLNFPAFICLEFVRDTLFALVAVQNKTLNSISWLVWFTIVYPLPFIYVAPYLTLFGQLVCCHTQFVQLCVRPSVYLSKCLQRAKIYVYSAVCCLVRNVCNCSCRDKTTESIFAFPNIFSCLFNMELPWEAHINS